MRGGGNPPIEGGPLLIGGGGPPAEEGARLPGRMPGRIGGPPPFAGGGKLGPLGPGPGGPGIGPGPAGGIRPAGCGAGEAAAPGGGRCWLVMLRL